VNGWTGITSTIAARPSGSPPGRHAAQTTRSLYQALVPLERTEEALTALEAAIAGLDGADREVALQLEAAIATASRLHPATYPRTANRPRRYAGKIEGHSRAERAAREPRYATPTLRRPGRRSRRAPEHAWSTLAPSPTSARRCAEPTAAPTRALCSSGASPSPSAAAHTRCPSARAPSSARSA
jgi:hypothetical protein